MKIVAIGGGEIGRFINAKYPGEGRYSIETFSIDEEVVKLSEKKHPRLLFLPTAANDDEEYCKVIRNYYGLGLGCNIDVLRLVNEPPFREEMERKILGADIIYVGGGKIPCLF